MARGRNSRKNNLDSRIASYNERESESRKNAGSEKVIAMMHKPGSQKK